MTRFVLGEWWGEVWIERERAANKESAATGIDKFFKCTCNERKRRSSWRGKQRVIVS